MKKFGFKEQMGVGNKGEADFIKYYADLEPIKSKEDLKYDFSLKDGKTVELKTDSYKIDKTPNFFLETISSTKSGKLGGPARAASDKVNYYIYYFINDRIFYWFDSSQLYDKFCQYIEEKKPELKSIFNRGWVTNGYAVSREYFEDICIKKDKFD